MRVEDRKVTPEIAVKILQEHGTMVSLDEAELILDFMYRFAKLVSDQRITVEKHNRYDHNPDCKTQTR